jgi:CDP-glucose 4,6-dehydratase
MNASACFADCYRGQHVVITGNTGFKGSWLSLWLHRLGAVVHGYSLPAPTEPSLFQKARLAGVVHHTQGDVRDLESFRAQLQSARPRFVFHLAAQPIVSLAFKDPWETISTNVMGTATVLDALRSVTWPCAAIMITSDKCYDNVEWPWGYRETDRLGGKDIYSGSKSMAELAIHCFFHSYFVGRQHKVRLAVGRAGNVIGGGDWAADRIVADCVKAFSAGNPVELRCPDAIRPWQHVLESLSGYLALGQELAERPTLHGEAFNFGPRANQNHKVVELLMDLARIWGLADGQKAYDVVTQEPFHEAGMLQLNCDKAALALRWIPTLEYGECVKMTGEWYRAVLRENADARALTLQQIAHYEDLAAMRGLHWRVGPSA